jgi:hypothetical protein
VPRRRRAAIDWWILGLFAFVLVLGLALALTIRSRTGSPYSRLAESRGAVQWPEDTRSRTGMTLAELERQMPPEIKIDETAPDETAPPPAPAPPERRKIQPIGTVVVARPGARPALVPVLNRDQAFQYIRNFRATLRAQPAP